MDLAPTTSNIPSKKSQLSGIGDAEKIYVNDYWQQFFEKKGAKAIWEELKPKIPQEKSKTIYINFGWLTINPTPEEMDQLGEGIIQYLVENNPQTKKLFLIGDSVPHSTKRLNTLSPHIGKLTTLTDLGLSYNNLTELPAALSNLLNLHELGLSGNQFKFLSANFYNLCNTAMMNGDKNLWLSEEKINQLKDVKSHHLSNEKLKELAHTPHTFWDKKVILFANMYKLNGESWSVALECTPPAASQPETIRNILAPLLGKTIYVVATKYLYPVDGKDNSVDVKEKTQDYKQHFSNKKDEYIAVDSPSLTPNLISMPASLLLPHKPTALASLAEKLSFVN